MWRRRGGGDGADYVNGGDAYVLRRAAGGADLVDTLTLTGETFGDLRASSFDFA